MILVKLLVSYVLPAVALFGGLLGTPKHIYSPPPFPVDQQSEALRFLAKEKLEDLMNTGYWSHTNSDGCNYSCRVDRAGMVGWVGENLYHGVCDHEYAFELWEKSPEHKAVLDHGYDRREILTGLDGQGGCYIVYEVQQD